MIAYRRDIDGLRALAVLAVILFHTKDDLMRGGFAGVDIFFVISGFLITSILKRDLHQGSFSIAEFYERRARRILPALLTVITATLLVFSMSLFPADYMEATKSAIAAIFSVSNIFFWHSIDYFAPASQEMPLLHTWSLGVEEQYYLIFPVLLFYLDKFFPEKRVAIILATLGLLSLAFAEYASRAHPSFAFYWLPARFWEMALGGLLAYLPHRASSLKISNSLSIAGLLMIVATYTFYDDKTPFPGIAALLPCIGAALLIIARDGFISDKILGNAAMNAIGRMSYSLYLWHWPVLAFWRTRFEEQTTIEAICALLVTFILAWLSWRFVETPFRNRAFLTRKQVFGFSIAAMLALTSAASFIVVKDGIPARFTDKVLAIAGAANDYKAVVYEQCIEPANRQDENCYFGDSAQKKVTAVIWGDSHAGANYPAIDAFAKEHHIRGIKFTKSSCPGFTGDYEFKHSDAPCRDFNKRVLEFIIADKNIRHVFFAGRWAPVIDTLSFEGTRDNALYKALSHTAEQLRHKGKQSYFIASEPEFEFNPPRCLSRRAAFGDGSFTCRLTTLNEYLEHEKLSLPVFSALAENYPVFFPHSVLCNKKECQVQNGDDVLYFDDDHLSRKGALYIVPGLTKAFTPYIK